MEENATGIARSKLRSLGAGKGIDPDASTLRLKFAFHLKPQAKPIEFSDEFYEKNLEQEYAIRYLETIGATPTAKNIAMVRKKMPMKMCEKTSAFRCRGWLTDTLYVTTDKDLEAPNEEAHGFDGADTSQAPAETGVKKVISEGTSQTKHTSDGLSMMWNNAEQMARAGAADNIVSKIGGQTAFGNRSARPGRRMHYPQAVSSRAVDGFMRAPTSHQAPFSALDFQESETIKTGISWSDGGVDAKQKFIVNEARSGLVKPLEITKDKIEEMQDAFIGNFPFGKFNPKMSHFEREVCSDILQSESVKRLIGLLCHYLYWMNLRPFGQGMRNEGDVLSCSKDQPTTRSKNLFDSALLTDTTLPSARVSQMHTQRFEALTAPQGASRRTLHSSGGQHRPHTSAYLEKHGSQLKIRLDSPKAGAFQPHQSSNSFRGSGTGRLQKSTSRIHPSIQIEDLNNRQGDKAGLSETEEKRLFAAIQQSYNLIHSQVCKAKHGVLVHMPILMLSIRDAIERIFWASYDYFKVAGDEGKALMEDLHQNVSHILDPKWYQPKLDTDSGLDIMQRTFGTAVKSGRHGTRSLKDSYYTTSSMMNRIYPNPQSAQTRSILRSRKLERSTAVPESSPLPLQDLGYTKYPYSSPLASPNQPAIDQNPANGEDQLLSRDRAKIYKEILSRTTEQNKQTYKSTKNRAFLERGRLINDQTDPERRREYLQKVHEKHIKKLLDQPQRAELQWRQWGK